ncbi:Arginine-tRNA-protein transferase [Dictyocaulus viviparus]|uniref:Arginyl-tRNA--protein transferase 1 n=1 Tax=Dictyocaulus viviparus TaxID=29172 RepID=A0A0D8XM06_DICVI|nr:Arginine-tRNA-protein transferase [Dictyocaulus viviparus]
MLTNTRLSDVDHRFRFRNLGSQSKLRQLPGIAGQWMAKVSVRNNIVCANAKTAHNSKKRNTNFESILIFRSGKYIYKPLMERTCCPQYTIRLDVTKYILSRSHRKVLRQMNEYLKNDTKPRSNPRAQEAMCCEGSFPKSGVVKEATNRTDSLPKKKSDNPVPKKKEIRRQRCFSRWRDKGLDEDEMKKARVAKEKARVKTVESYILEPDKEWKHTLEVKLVSTSSKEFTERFEESFLLFKKYQEEIHSDNHVSRSGFRRFLVDTPLFDDKVSSSSERLSFGSYHLWYILDDKLLAVGVIDILPRCVSSKYMYYDPEYGFLNLGTYTALREIAFTRSLMKIQSEVKYYYMGYYIITCQKMRYKGFFRPSELLCDRTFQWVPLDRCQQLLQENDNKFTVFLPDLPPATMQTRDNLLLLVDGKIVQYSEIHDLGPALRDLANSEAIKENLDSFAMRIGCDMNRLVMYLPEFQNLKMAEV